MGKRVLGPRNGINSTSMDQIVMRRKTMEYMLEHEVKITQLKSSIIKQHEI